MRFRRCHAEQCPISTTPVLYQSLFSGTSFAGSRLHRADFHDAQLRKANFEDADLLDVNFLGASLSELNLEDAVCSNIHSNTPWELRE